MWKSRNNASHMHDMMVMLVSKIDAAPPILRDLV